MLFSLVGCNMIEKTQKAINATVLAKVGDKKITRGDVDKLIASTLSYYKEYYGKDFEKNEDLQDTLKEARQNGVEKLVEEAVLEKLKDDKIIKVKYSDDELKEDLQSSIDNVKQNYEDNDSYLKYLKSNGFNSEKKYEEYLKKQLVLNKVAEKLVKNIKVTNKDIENYYNKNKESYVQKPGATVTHLLFTDSKTGHDDAIAAKKLFEQGKTLEEISEMPEYKDKCKYEDLGHQDFDTTQLVSEFVDGFKNLPANKLSDPVETSYGWHLILNTEVNKDSVQQSLDEVKDEIKSTLLYNKQSKEYESKMKKYKKQFKVKTYTDRL